MTRKSIRMKRLWHVPHMEMGNANKISSKNKQGRELGDLLADGRIILK
jgi:hypothetical protein